MNNYKKVQIASDGDEVILQIYDEEMADEFDDFLKEILDLEISLKFEEQSVSFFFDKKFTVKQVEVLYEQFEQNSNWQQNPVLKKEKD